jgi:hypothetical protein
MLESRWNAAVDAGAARLARLPAAPAGAQPSAALDLAAARAAMGPALGASAPASPMALLAAEGTDGTAVFLRSMRPMAARLGAALLRVTEAGSIIAAGGALGLAVGGLPGTVIGIAGGIGASWGLDWVLNRLDASLNRAGFEAQALEAVARAEERLAGGAAEVAAALLGARLAALDAPGGCR